MGSDACQRRGFWRGLVEAIVLLEVHGNVPAHSCRTRALWTRRPSRSGSRRLQIQTCVSKAASLVEHLPFTDRNGRGDDVAANAACALHAAKATHGPRQS